MAKTLSDYYNDIENLMREARDAAYEERNTGLFPLMIVQPIIKTCSDETIGHIVGLLQKEEFRKRFKRDEQ